MYACVCIIHISPALEVALSAQYRTAHYEYMSAGGVFFQLLNYLCFISSQKHLTFPTLHYMKKVGLSYTHTQTVFFLHTPVVFYHQAQFYSLFCLPPLSPTQNKKHWCTPLMRLPAYSTFILALFLLLSGTVSFPLCVCACPPECVF